MKLRSQTKTDAPPSSHGSAASVKKLRSMRCKKSGDNLKRADYTPGGHLTQAFVDMIDAGNAQAQLILKAIAQHADWETGECFPSANSIADIAKCSVKTVRRYLRQLESDELIKTEARHGADGRQSSNKITLVDYAEWVVASRKGGIVHRAKKVAKYADPPGQDDQGGPGQLDQGGDGQSDQGPLDNVSSPPGQLLSMAPGHMVSTHNEPSGNTEENDSPPPPQGGRERGNKYSDLIKQIEDDGKLPVVIEHLVVPLLGGLTIQHPSPIALLRDIRDQRIFATLPIVALKRLAEIVKQRRKKLISPKDVLEYLDTAVSGLPMVRIEKGAPSWAAWCEELKKQDLPKMVRFYEGQGYMMQWTYWPYWHPQYRPEIADGRAA